MQSSQSSPSLSVSSLQSLRNDLRRNEPQLIVRKSKKKLKLKVDGGSYM
jgi:hypothetical protein